MKASSIPNPAALRRRLSHLATILAVAAAALLSLSLAATPASAGAGGSCASGRVCLYENNDFNNGNVDHWRDFTADDSTLTNNNWFNNQGSSANDIMNDETSSIKNRRGCSVRLWQNSSYGGASSTFGNGVNDGILSNNSIGDNRASSVDVLC